MAKPPNIAKDGWISVEVDDDLRAHVHVASDGRDLVINGLYLEGDQITTATFARIHPARILAAATEHSYSYTKTIEWSKDESQIGKTEQGSTSGAQLVKLVALFGEDADTTLGALRPRAKGRRVLTLGGKPREPLGRPGEDLDEFYRRVAAAYTSAKKESGRPAAALAEENEVPVDTMHRWVKEARRRGHLAPSRRGRTS